MGQTTNGIQSLDWNAFIGARDSEVKGVSEEIQFGTGNAKQISGMGFATRRF